MGKLGQQLVREDFDIETPWHQDWATSNPDLFTLVSDPEQQPLGFDFPKKIWTALNQIPTMAGANTENIL